MTSSSPSPEHRPELPGGFAKHDPERIPLAGPFVSDIDMPGPIGGVFLQDMPAGRPVRPKVKVKGVPGASTGTAGEDYQPGQGSWREVQ